MNIIQDGLTIKNIKFIALFVVTTIALYYVPENKITHQEIIIIAAISTIIFVLLEILCPSIKINKGFSKQPE
jgi:hypothetical protein